MQGSCAQRYACYRFGPSISSSRADPGFQKRELGLTEGLDICTITT